MNHLLYTRHQDWCFTFSSWINAFVTWMFPGYSFHGSFLDDTHNPPFASFLQLFALHVLLPQSYIRIYNQQENIYHDTDFNSVVCCRQCELPWSDKPAHVTGTMHNSILPLKPWNVLAPSSTHQSLWSFTASSFIHSGWL